MLALGEECSSFTFSHSEGKAAYFQNDYESDTVCVGITFMCHIFCLMVAILIYNKDDGRRRKHIK